MFHFLRAFFWRSYDSSRSSQRLPVSDGPRIRRVDVSLEGGIIGKRSNEAVNIYKHRCVDMVVTIWQEFGSFKMNTWILLSTESFKSPKNLAKMSEFKSDQVERTFCYIKGSVHQNHLDAPFIVQVI